MANNIWRRKPSGRLSGSNLVKKREGSAASIIAQDFFEAAGSGGSIPITISENSGATYAGVTDTGIKQANATTNFGTNPDIYVTAWDTSDHKHGLIKFTGLSNVGVGTVSNARIRFYCHTNNGGSTINIFALRVDFDAATATWDIRQTATNWTTAGARSTASDYNNTLLDSVVVTTTGSYYEFSGAAIDAYVQAIINGGTDYGLILYNNGEPATPGLSHEIIFASSNGTNGQRPEMAFDWLDGSSSSSGSAAVTQALNTSAIAGTALDSGSLARTQALNTSVISGTVLANGSMARLQADTSAISATNLVSGLVGVTDTLDTSTASATVGAAGITGSASVTQALNTVLSGGGLLPSFVQSNSAVDTSSSSSIAVNLTGVQAGSALVFAAQWAQQAVSSVSDGTNNLTLRGSIINGESQDSAIYTLDNVTSGSKTITLTLTAARQWKWAYLVEVKDCDVAAFVGIAQQWMTGNTSTDGMTSGTLSSVPQGAFLIGTIFDTTSTGSFSAGTGFTYDRNIDPSDVGGGAEYRANVTAGNYAATFTQGNTNNAHVHVIALKKSAVSSNTNLISGTAALTQANSTTIVATNSLSGSVVRTQASNTSNISGTASITGTAARTQALNSASVIATNLVSGTASLIQTNTDSVVSTVAISGSSTASQALNSSSASATVTSSGITGTVAVTQALNNSAIVSTVAISGSASTTQNSNTSTITSTVSTSGSSAVTQVINSTTASGNVGISGSASRTQNLNTLTASATNAISSNSAAIQRDISSAISTVLISGTVSRTQELNSASISASVSSGINAAAALVERETASANGTVVISGTVARNQNSNSSSISGSVSISGSAAVAQVKDSSQVTAGVFSGSIASAAVVQNKDSTLSVFRPTFVQSNANDNLFGASTTCAVTLNNVRAGSTLLFVGQWQGTLKEPLSVSDGTTPFTLVGSLLTQSNQTSGVYKLENVTSGNKTITLNLVDASSWIWIYAVEIYGSTVTRVHGIAQAVQGNPGTAPNDISSGTFNTVPVGAFLLGVTLDVDNLDTTRSAGTGWTLDRQITDSHPAGAAEYRANVSAGNYAATFTAGNDRGCITHLVVLVSSSSGSSAVTQAINTAVANAYNAFSAGPIAVTQRDTLAGIATSSINGSSSAIQRTSLAAAASSSITGSLARTQSDFAYGQGIDTTADYRANSTATSYATSNSFTVNKQAAQLEGDYVLLELTIDANSTQSITWPSGFTQIANIVTASPEGVLKAVAGKFAGSSEPSSYNVTISGGVTQGALTISAWKNIKASNPFTVYSGETVTTAGSSPVPKLLSSVDSLVGDIHIVASSADFTVGTDVWNSDTLSGFTEVYDTGGEWIHTSLQYKRNLAGGMVGTRTLSLNRQSGTGQAGLLAYQLFLHSEIQVLLGVGELVQGSNSSSSSALVGATSSANITQKDTTAIVASAVITGSSAVIQNKDNSSGYLYVYSPSAILSATIYDISTGTNVTKVLTDYSSDDWIRFGEGSTERKVGGSLIGAVTSITGGATYNGLDTDGFFKYAYSSSTSGNTSVADTGGGNIHVCIATGQGLSFTVPSSSNDRLLTLFTTHFGNSASIRVTLSDGSVAPLVIPLTDLSVVGEADTETRITYRANGTGTMLVEFYSTDVTNFNIVSIKAIVLSPINSSLIAGSANVTESLETSYSFAHTNTALQSKNSASGTGSVSISSTTAVQQRKDTSTINASLFLISLGIVAVTQNPNTSSGVGTVGIDFALPTSHAIMLQEIWQRLELDRDNPITIVQHTDSSTLTVGNITQELSDSSITRQGSSTQTGDIIKQIREIWERLGLDPNKPVTQSDTQITVGDIVINITGSIPTIVSRE
jgi:hypothetical protein